MLDCRADHKKQTARDRNRRYRDRRRRGRFCVTITIDGTILDYLQHTRWLTGRDSHDVEKVGEAITGLLQMSAKI
jgi:hypothetical protein